MKQSLDVSRWQAPGSSDAVNLSWPPHDAEPTVGHTVGGLGAARSRLIDAR
ncbi:UNVERIFIED_ORG: hypothetical protein J2W65_001675 [Pseudomonas parafulva]|nr:hypothetical protein [Pseudomonas parafulva]